MPRTRQHNVTAAQWSVNGGALGAPDLTEPGASVFGDNVFSIAAQRQRLPKDVFKKLQTTLAAGAPLDVELAGARTAAKAPMPAARKSERLIQPPGFEVPLQSGLGPPVAL